MRTSIIIMLAMALLAVSCQTRRMVVVDEEPPVVIAPVEEPDPIPEPPIEEQEIVIREEKFSFENEEDEMIHEPNRYFVIVGSFRNPENAHRYTQTLKEQGFTPVMLLSETGFTRVSVNSYTNEASARARVLQVREDYPQYYDTWLLIRENN